MKKSHFFWITVVFIILSVAALALAQSGSDLTSPNMPDKMKRVFL